ncbi:MAG: type III-A CRISPR-associated protein Csm2 [bacterium]|nr:type III-A CRISPR-associated protein Csm2 [bacterium]
MNNKILNRNPGGQNRPQDQRRGFNEDDLRNEIKRDLGDNYINDILNFTSLDPSVFTEVNNNIKTFIKALTQSKAITSTKMRKIYELIKKSNSLNQMLLQIPYLAYMVGKETSTRSKRELGKIYILFKDTIERAKDDKHIYNIKKFTEALVAYQKYYEED